ncbi:hypothetical protein Acr_15g0011900 [Actinidia rufa]|uniref:Uncharacterized protein n=1 Tax=Actinidia rufa TaxID=165716 RepID=A0A7J0FV56_9ERIC|nr:hypothetical protein Acr_15g0011900 [Actinidia rufa]
MLLLFHVAAVLLYLFGICSLLGAVTAVHFAVALCWCCGCEALAVLFMSSVCWWLLAWALCAYGAGWSTSPDEIVASAFAAILLLF